VNRQAYLLALLLISAQVDDAWTGASVLPSAPLADDNDEYLPAQRQPLQTRLSPGQWPRFAFPTTQAADCSVVRRCVPFAWDLTTPFTPRPLYVFMSLQI
jgi:hypothetical protein